jgi:hypothetical protein
MGLQVAREIHAHESRQPHSRPLALAAVYISGTAVS